MFGHLIVLDGYTIRIYLFSKVYNPLIFVFIKVYTVLFPDAILVVNKPLIQWLVSGVTLFHNNLQLLARHPHNNTLLLARSIGSVPNQLIAEDYQIAYGTYQTITTMQFGTSLSTAGFTVCYGLVLFRLRRSPSARWRTPAGYHHGLPYRWYRGCAGW
jgi:hypothetical protein